MCKNDMIKSVNGRNYMTEEERRYKILKKESYEELAKKERKDGVIYGLATGMGAAALIITANQIIMSDAKSLIIGCLGVLVPGLVTGENLFYTISSICKKTMYESKIEDIDRELEMLELNEKGGMKR